MYNLTDKTKVNRSKLIMYKTNENEYNFAVVSDKNAKKLLILTKNVVIENFDKNKVFTFIAERNIGSCDDIVEEVYREIFYFFKLKINDEYHALVKPLENNFDRRLNYIEKYCKKPYITLKELKKIEKDVNKYYFSKQNKKIDEDILNF